MGANIVNTVAEGIAPTLEQITGARVGLKILTNLCLQRITRVQFKIPVEQLKWKGVDGRVVAERIIEAYNFADDDPFRAATHNKGVMNGIDAVAIALGQDWRAIEASAHAYVQQRLGYYGPVTAYAIVDEPSTPASEAARGALPPMITLPPKNGDSAPGTYLVGCIEMPFAVGTKGGALQTHPMYRLTHAVLGNPDAATLAQIMCAVGLAQNFAAIRALAIEGIQRGHMGLHARNIAIAAGVPNGMVAEVAAYMVVRKKVH
jgi:hydroxymethylglutaryl-CoA synthase